MMRSEAELDGHAADLRSAGTTKRILLYVHDRIGIGHLQTVSKLVSHLVDDFACAIICGHRGVDWIIPDRCEYFHVPSLTALVPAQAQSRGRRPWLAMSSAEARSFRGTLITSFITAFRPDIMLVEHFPLGINDELETILGNTACPKVFSTGGLLTVHDRERANIFNSRGVTAIGNLYKKIIVTADSKIVAIGSEYNLPAEVQTMVESVGYVSRQMASHAVARMRHDRRLPSGAQWVVCSAGGGALGEEFMLDCVELAHETKHVFFDIVFGPTSSLSANAPCKEVREEGRVILHRSVEGLAELHGSADVVICTGGANSLIEAMEGGAWIISCPVQTKFDDEQFVHARRLAQYYPIQLVADRSDLPRVFDGTIADVRSVGRGAPVRESNMLSFEGATRAAEIIRTLVPQ